MFYVLASKRAFGIKEIYYFHFDAINYFKKIIHLNNAFM